MSMDASVTRSPHYAEHLVLSHKLDECFASCRAGKSPPRAETIVQDLDSISYALSWTADRFIIVDIRCPYILPSAVASFANSTLRDMFSDVSSLEGSVGVRLKLPRSFRDKNALSELMQARTRILSSWLFGTLQSLVSCSPPKASEAVDQMVNCNLLHPNLAAWTDQSRKLLGLVSLMPARRINPEVGWSLLEAAIKAHGAGRLLEGGVESSVVINLCSVGEEEVSFPKECRDLLHSVPAKVGGPQPDRENRYLYIRVNCASLWDELDEEEIASLLDELVNLRYTLDHTVRAGLIGITTASRNSAQKILEEICREEVPAA
ncbi:hypothetical protein FOL47_006790 [Perkinsus chesapeaki]|uniref:Uncharacterized protein n=1 Tax=Perkinsus chesapeaki TaxID=330153 RepID=A0A7J6LQL1_PERCH|nr:hypothetical protein FOL47_006790 [Perkinsus chesapeaki]